MERTAAKDGIKRARQSGRGVAIFHGLALTGAAAAAVTTTSAGDWRLVPLAVLAACSVLSGLTYVETGSTKLTVSGSFLAVVLAAVLLGGGPASLVGVTTVACVSVRMRPASHYVRNNAVVFAWFPLVASWFFHFTTRLLHLGTTSPAFYLLVMATFVVALTLNFLGVAGYQSYLDRSSLAHKTREALLPLLPAELFSALLTMAATYVAVQLGTTGLALFAMVLIIFQYLIGELLKSKHRGEKLHRIATTDELTGLANRERFRARLDERIAAAREAGDTFGVMLLDLDRFKEINDTLGHHFGDEMLRDLGPRLGETVG
ncbi:MAG TPA: GGDEF domain-containing protein, partial [Solirubrobacteraceae bacterium]|nr:GGDEF domain-containing protein [Solirubrobacteraceae bacterium]